jgi:hypothetical protein
MALSVGVFALGGCDSSGGSGAPADAVSPTNTKQEDPKSKTKAAKSIKNLPKAAPTP